MSADRPTPMELNAFVDGELDLRRQIEIEAELAGDETLQAQLRTLTGISRAVRQDAEHHRAPASLRRNVAPGAFAAAPAPATVAARRPVRALAAGMAMAVLLSWALVATLSRPDADELVLREVVASHVRSTLSDRLIDVASSDQHTVKPWLSARLDFSPPVAQHPTPAATLAGARVDYVDGRPVAALVYRQHQHVIDLFVWPTGSADAAARIESRNGFHAAHAVRRGMAYWAVSDINREELLALLAAQTSGVPQGADR